MFGLWTFSGLSDNKAGLLSWWDGAKPPGHGWDIGHLGTVICICSNFKISYHCTLSTYIWVPKILFLCLFGRIPFSLATNCLILFFSYTSVQKLSWFWWIKLTVYIVFLPSFPPFLLTSLPPSLPFWCLEKTNNLTPINSVYHPPIFIQPLERCFWSWRVHQHHLKDLLKQKLLGSILEYFTWWVWGKPWKYACLVRFQETLILQVWKSPFEDHWLKGKSKAQVGKVETKN